MYKESPAGTNPVVLSGFGDASEARIVINDALMRFSSTRDRQGQSVAGSTGSQFQRVTRTPLARLQRTTTVVALLAMM